MLCLLSDMNHTGKRVDLRAANTQVGSTCKEHGHCWQLVTKSRAERWISMSLSLLIRMLFLFWVTCSMNYLWSNDMPSDLAWIKITWDSAQKMYQSRPFYLKTTSNNITQASASDTKWQRTTFKSTSNDNRKRKPLDQYYRPSYPLRNHWKNRGEKAKNLRSHIYKKKDI